MANCIVHTGNNSGVNIRASKSTGSSLLGVINNGVSVNIVRCDDTWATLMYNGTPAFVQHQYLQNPPTTKGDGLTVGDGAICNMNQVNIRSAANGTVTGNYLNKGDSISVSAKTLTNGYYWYKFGTNSWIRGDYLAPYTGSSGGSSTTLRLGDSGNAVIGLQQRLLDLHYTYGHSDGLFDSATEWAVKYFQKRNGLTADGIVGTQTMAKLNSTNPVIGVDTNVVNRSIGDPAESQIKMSNNLWSNVAFDASNTSTVETIGSSGNAPTALAIAFTTLWEHAITPPVIAQWAVTHGYRDPNGNTGVTSAFFSAASGEWDERYAGIATSFTDMKNYINQGGLCVVRLTGASVHSYCTTTGATYVVVYKVDNNYVYLKNTNAGSEDPISVTVWQTAPWVKEVHKYGLPA